MFCWRIMMSTPKKSGLRIATRIPGPKRYDLIPNRSAEKKVKSHTFPVFIDRESLDTLNRFSEKFKLTGIEGNHSEIYELTIFETFLADHVQQNRICDVQCMLLWSEWVRTCQRQTSGFPTLIREKALRSVITDTFGVEIANHGYWGPVYPGIKFVP